MPSQFEAVAGKSIGYVSGNGGAVTQETNKATGVTLSKPCGQITTADASLAGGAEVSFVVTNTFVAATDVVAVSIASGASTGTYVASVSAVAAGSFTVTLSNLGTTAGEALVINFVVLKGASA
jgi:hypothetical protein